MKFHFGHLTRHGFFVEEQPLPITEKPHPHILVGLPNVKARLAFRLWIGTGLYGKIKKVDFPCPKEGDPELGKCPHCGVLVTPEKLKTVPSGKTQLVNGVPVELMNKTMEHDLIPKAASIPYGSLEFGKKHGTLIVVEEKAKDREGRIGLLLRADAPPRGLATVDFIQCDKDPFRATVNARAKGEIWANPRNPRAGVTAECFMVLIPGDRVKITRTYEDGHEDVTMIGMMPDMSLKSIQPAEVQVAEPAPKEVSEPSPAEVEKALQDGVERFKQ